MDSHGKERQRSGSKTESVFDGHHEVARMLRVAYLFKRPTPFVVTKDLGEGRMMCTKGKSAGVDYSGVLSDGRAVFVEAKRHSGGAFPLKNILDAQMLEMEEIRRVCPSALRILAIEWFPTNPICIAYGYPISLSQIVVLPWSNIDRSVSAEAKSVSFEILSENVLSRNAKTYLEKVRSM